MGQGVERGPIGAPDRFFVPGREFGDLVRVGDQPAVEVVIGKAIGHQHRIDLLLMNGRSEEHTSELQSLMRISYAVFCLKKKKTKINKPHNQEPHHTTNYYYI